MPVSTIRLCRCSSCSCQAELLAQVAKDGRRKYSAHVVSRAYTQNIHGAHTLSRHSLPETIWLKYVLKTNKKKKKKNFIKHQRLSPRRARREIHIACSLYKARIAPSERAWTATTNRLPTIGYTVSFPRGSRELKPGPLSPRCKKSDGVQRYP